MNILRGGHHIQNFNKTSFHHRNLGILVPQHFQKQLPYLYSTDNRLINLLD
ncbi:hypothetical protein BT93_H2305 [Corymbia citriodora subsp. variegata]|nr:hypothetical protein BT93_H2305 [Corymbia citriodora subsp. variegata]